MLRGEQCQLAISPRPPDAGDILQKRLFEGEYRVFYDGDQREPPGSLGDYLAADHITVAYDPPRTLDIDQVLASRGVDRRFLVRVPGFSGIPPFLRGSRLLATLPGLLANGQLRGFANCPVPVECPSMPMYMIWHMRYRYDPVHVWLRKELEVLVARVLA
jgi:DNA-binding transcriptional LysR family regulator